MTFNEWFMSHDWWKKNSQRERLEPVWEKLIDRGFTPEEAESLLDTVIGAMHSEYGC